MNENLISSTTKRNWKRLGVKAVEERLSKRANKRFSSKNIIPIEYFQNKNNLSCLNEILKNVNTKDIKSVIYSIALVVLKYEGLILLKENGNYLTSNKYLRKILDSFDAEFDSKFLSIKLPNDEPDYLGIVYQSLLKEGCKNINGSYYTPTSIINNALGNLDKNSTFLDPCCGTGSFLLNAADKIKDPNKIYGADKDEIACFIAKINLIIKFKHQEFDPKIYNIDFLTDNKIFNKKFDIIATNPPWGAMNKKDCKNIYPEITSGESFAYFIVKSNKMLSENGNAVFVLPQSILNVATHKDIREFILKNFYINSIVLLGRAFSGVLAKAIILNLSKTKQQDCINIKTKTSSYSVSQEFYQSDVNYNFLVLDNEDIKILKKIYSIKYETLDKSIFAVGVVTGNNKKYISKRRNKNFEPIYTGKDIQPYFIKTAKNFIKYDRKNFQQVAQDEIYRSKEKLVYKFISSKLVFAYDNTSSLFLNSANILIPKLKNHDAKTALAYLNSKLFKYIYIKKFNEIKILKSALLQLPFPELTKKESNKIKKLVDLYLKGNSESVLHKIEQFVYKSFKLSEKEIELIEKSI